MDKTLEQLMIETKDKTTEKLGVDYMEEVFSVATTLDKDDTYRFVKNGYRLWMDKFKTLPPIKNLPNQDLRLRENYTLTYMLCMEYITNRKSKYDEVK